MVYLCIDADYLHFYNAVELEPLAILLRANMNSTHSYMDLIEFVYLYILEYLMLYNQRRRGSFFF